MKKSLLLLLIIFFAISFAACGQSMNVPEMLDKDESIDDAETEDAVVRTPEEDAAPIETPEPEQNKEAQNEPLALGSTIEFDDLMIYFKSSEVREIDNQFADAEYAVLIEVEIQNLMDETHGLNMFHHTCYSPNGLEADSAGAYFDTAVDWMGDMRPDSVMTGHLVYVYTEDGEYVIEFSQPFGDTIEVFIPVIMDEIISSDIPSQIVPNENSTGSDSVVYGIGDSIEFDDLTIKFTGASVEEIDNQFADADFAVLVHVEITNNKDETHSLNMFYHKCYAPNGLETDSAGAYFDTAVDWMGDMRSGATMTGDLVYEYTEDGDYILSFSSILDDPLEVKINLVK